MFRKNKTLEQIEREVDKELAKKTPQQIAELKKDIQSCNKKIAEQREEIEFFKKQITEIRSSSIHQKNLNTFVMLVADLVKADEEGKAVPPSQTKLFIMQQKYNVKGMHLLPEELESRIKDELQKENVEIITDINKKIKTREENIQGLKKQIEAIKAGKDREEYIPPRP